MSQAKAPNNNRPKLRGKGASRLYDDEELTAGDPVHQSRPQDTMEESLPRRQPTSSEATALANFRSRAETDDDTDQFSISDDGMESDAPNANTTQSDIDTIKGDTEDMDLGSDSSDDTEVEVTPMDDDTILAPDSCPPLEATALALTSSSNTEATALAPKSLTSTEIANFTQSEASSTTETNALAQHKAIVNAAFGYGSTSSFSNNRRHSPLRVAALPPAKVIKPIYAVPHPWTRHFHTTRIMPATDKDLGYSSETTNFHAVAFPDNCLNDFANSINLDDINQFRHLSHDWFNQAQAVPPPTFELSSDMQFTSRKPEGVNALYYVAYFRNRNAILQAVHPETFAPDRADLRKITVNKYSLNSLEGKVCDPLKQLNIGDQLYVQELLPTAYARRSGFRSVRNTQLAATCNATYNPAWNVARFQPTARLTCQNRFALALAKLTRNQGKEVHGHRIAVEGSNVIHHLPLDKDRPELFQDALLVGDVYYPPSNTMSFSMNAKTPEDQNILLDYFRDIEGTYRPRIQFTNWYFAPDNAAALLHHRNKSMKHFPNQEEALKWIARTFALSVPAMGALTREVVDTRPYSVNIETINDTANIEFRITTPNGPPSLSSWKSGARLSIRIPGVKKQHQATSLRTHLVEAEGNIKVTARCTRATLADLRTAQTANPAVAITVQQSIHSATANPAERMFTGGEEDIYNRIKAILGQNRATEIINALFGDGIANIQAQPAPERKVRYDEQTYTLTQEQTNIVESVLKNHTILVVPSSFGAGKTFITIVAQGELARQDPEGFHIVTAHSNIPVANAVAAAAKLKDYEDLHMVRLISAENLELQAVRTDYDFPVLFRSVLSSPAVQQDLDVNTLARVRKYLSKHPQEDDQENPEMLELQFDFLRLHGSASIAKVAPTTDAEVALNVFLNYYRPVRIFATIATLLTAFSAEGLWDTLQSKCRSIIIDESSQLTEANLIAATATFTSAQFVLIGDPRQLPPYAPSMDSLALPALANGDLLSRSIQQQLLPTLPLRGVYRSHPRLTRTLSAIFYADQPLVALATAEARSSTINQIRMPNPRSPWAVINLAHGERRVGESWVNEEEANIAVHLADRLLEVMPASELGIVCLFRPQADLLADRLQNRHILVGTADSLQGKELRATIVCTSRTSNTSGSDFFGEPRRLNVALSRAREATFVIGNRQAFRSQQYWAKFVKKMDEEKVWCSAEEFFQANAHM